MKCRTVKQIQAAIQKITETSGIFMYTFKDNEIFEWILPYCDIVDNILCIEKGSLYLISNLWINENATLSEICCLTTAVRMGILKHEYELKKLIETLDIQYNPIHNVDEDTIETYIGDGTNVGKKIENGRGDNKSKNTTDDLTHMTYGTYQEKTNTTVGEETDTGSETNTNEYGRITGQWDTSNNVAPMDSDEFHSDTENVNNHHEDAHNDTLKKETSNTIGAREDNSVHTVNAREDDSDRVIDSITSTSYSNNILTNTDNTTSTSYSKHIIRKGNIGVTSTQQLITQEREIARFSISQEIINIFVLELCNGVYKDDCFARDTEWGDYIW